MRSTAVADRIAKGTKEEINIDELGNLQKEMADAVTLLEFERAAEIRDRIKAIKRKLEIAEGRIHQKKKYSRK